MASISDVEAALVGLINGVIYPTGSPPSALGYPVKIYAGWPDPGTLETDMTETAGKPGAAHVSVYPLPSERNTTRYPSERVEKAAPVTTYTLTAQDQTITVGGAAPSTYVAQNLAAFVNGRPFVVQAQAGDAPAALAAALQAAIDASFPGSTLSGSTITLPPTARLGAVQVGSVGSTTREVGRQQKQFQISVWSSNPASRAQVADAFLPVLVDNYRLTLADGTFALLLYQGSREDDFTQKQRIYRRSLIFTVEFAITITEAAPQMVAGVVQATGGNGEDLVVDLTSLAGLLDLGDTIVTPLL